MLKKDLQKIVALFAVVAANLSFATQKGFANESKDGFTAKLDSRTNLGSGRALVSVEDFKILVGLNGRDPQSAQPVTETKKAKDLPKFEIGMNPKELGKVSKAVQKIEVRRAELTSKLVKAGETKRAELKTKRRKIQSDRLGTSQNGDRKLMKSLYDSVIQESNLDNEISLELAKFDQSNAVTLDYLEVAGTRHVAAIYIGQNQVWRSIDASHLAKK